MLPLLLLLLHITLGDYRIQNTELLYNRPACTQDVEPAFNNALLQRKTA